MGLQKYKEIGRLLLVPTKEIQRLLILLDGGF